MHLICLIVLVSRGKKKMGTPDCPDIYPLTIHDKK